VPARVIPVSAQRTTVTEKPIVPPTAVSPKEVAPVGWLTASRYKMCNAVSSLSAQGKSSGQWTPVAQGRASIGLGIMAGDGEEDVVCASATPGPRRSSSRASARQDHSPLRGRALRRTLEARILDGAQPGRVLRGIIVSMGMNLVSLCGPDAAGRPRSIRCSA